MGLAISSLEKSVSVNLFSAISKIDQEWKQFIPKIRHLDKRLIEGAFNRGNTVNVFL